MKKLTFYLIGFLCLNFSAIAQEADPLNMMNQANKEYDSGNYEAAANTYKLLLDRNYTSEDLHFNYANSLFKSNNLALAILHYEKALKQNPNSEDAAYNLKIAYDRTVDKIDQVPELFIYRWWKAVYNLYSADKWAKLMITVLIVTLIGFGCYKLSANLLVRKFGFGMMASGVVMSLSFLLFAASQRNHALSSTHAIIMEPTVDILSAPSSGSSQLFVLHEGTKVKIEDTTEEWMEVSLPNGNQGWVNKVSIAQI